AQIAVSAGTHMVIASGKEMNPVAKLANGGRCTWILARTDPVASRKRLVSGARAPTCAAPVDAGAVAARATGNSLLPAGVTGVEGRFDRGDAIIIKGPDGEELGRGLSAYTHEDAARIAGHKSGEISEILGYRGRAELIHRDDMALKRKAP